MSKSKLNRYKVFDYVLMALFVLFILLTLYPLYYVIIGSFNEGLDYLSGGVYLFPRKPTINNYYIVFANSKLWHAYLVTISRTLLGTVSGVLFTAVVAYAMSRKELLFRNFFYFLNIFTMFFGGGLIPFFLIIRVLGLYDTYALYIIPCLYSVYHMIIIANYFRSLPEELREAAIIDGAGELRLMFLIAMPLSMPVLATVGLWVAVGHWNSYFDAMVYTKSSELETLQYYLMKLVNSKNIDVGSITLPEGVTANMTAEVVTFATITVSTLPILFVFPFLSKYLEKGIMMGSLKG